jgi:uncharacterized protein YecE (DUF72 family)
MHGQWAHEALVRRHERPRLRLRGEGQPPTHHLRLDRLDGLVRVLSRRPHVRWVLEVRQYGGSYTEAMLAADAERAAGWTRGSRDAYVDFNNNGRAAAVRNARRLSELLRARAHRRVA